MAPRDKAGAPPAPAVAPRFTNPHSGLAARLIAWQRSQGRHHLPWQGSQDPYRVWLSEIMLQQTQVSTVLDYYPRFLARFPTVQDLAAAPLDDVLGLWSGLGYYSRARNLHHCAQAVCEQHGGQFPRSAAGLETLPGIGRSTAAAVAAFCYGERVAILDGNVRRVLSRALGYAGDMAQQKSVNELWAMADALLPKTDIEPYTQGLMDLGASLCGRKPDCKACPWSDLCTAHAEGEPTRYPVKTKKLKRSARDTALLWLSSTQPDGTEWIWLEQRPATGIWSGLWSLPEFDDVDALFATTHAWPGQTQAHAPQLHVLTHVDWTLRLCRHTLPPGHPIAPAAAAPWLADWASSQTQGRWWRKREALRLGLPAPVRRWLEIGADDE